MPPELPSSVTVRIGAITANKKCVTYAQTECNNPPPFGCTPDSTRVNTDNPDAQDEFDVTHEGDQVCAVRTDKTSGWGMHLAFKCCPLEGYELPDCHCKSPGRSPPNNGYKCTDGLEAHCAVNERCNITGTFKLGRWRDACFQVQVGSWEEIVGSWEEIGAGRFNSTEQ